MDVCRASSVHIEATEDAAAAAKSLALEHGQSAEEAQKIYEDAITEGTTSTKKAKAEAASEGINDFFVRYIFCRRVVMHFDNHYSNSTHAEASAKRKSSSSMPVEAAASTASSVPEEHSGPLQSAAPASNTEYYAELQSALEVIDAHPTFKDLHKKPPLAIVAKEITGVQAPFSATEAETALQQKGLYRCAGNLFWQNMFNSPTPQVPLRMERVKAWKEFKFGKPPRPQHLDHMLHFAVHSPQFDVDNPCGPYHRVSPEELSHAVVLAMAESILQARESDEQASLEAWLPVVLSCPTVFHLVSGESAMYGKAFDLRQEVCADNDGARRTARQWCIEAMHRAFA